MITPAFEITQDSCFLTITIKVPFARVSEVDVYIDGDDFKFYAKPYFLRLSLPGRIVEDGRQTAKYNADEGVFTICVPKETPEEHFEGLNLLTSLLAPRGTKSCKPLIEEIGSPSELPPEDDEEFDWQIEQTPFEEPLESALNPQCSYGFGNLRSGVFGRLQDELNDIIDLRDPDITPVSERTQRRLAAEKDKFDPDHYLADLFEDDAVKHLLKYQPWWVEGASDGSQEGKVIFSNKEKDQLRKFTNKSYLLDKNADRTAFLGLIDLLLAYCYEIRVTEGDRSVESAWNIRKLSGTLSWFENYKTVQEVLVSFGRRVLCYPLHRHFSLVTKAIEDTCSLLKLGKAAILKCLLDIHVIFQENDPAYILNDLYVTDYCVWIQKVKSKKVSSLLSFVQEASISKTDLGLELEELEEAARLVQEEEEHLLSESLHVPRRRAELLDSDTSSGSSSSGTEDSASEEDEPPEAKEPALEESPESLQRETAKLLIEDIETSQEAAEHTHVSPEPTSVPSQAAEAIEEKPEAVIIHSEDALEQAAAHSNTHGVPGTVCALRDTEETAVTCAGREFLEVTPWKNPMLIVPQTDENDTMSEEA
ncbi:protein SHQ1 homolog [Spea bombifrons]|uniref:protein SHQ1 homolog n=1 Tax=Spea bombifrons TaxID=233779 RepID=UPI00234B0F07|nr:protein SHQ1 homolog [Spea bombifrons]